MSKKKYEESEKLNKEGKIDSLDYPNVGYWRLQFELSDKTDNFYIIIGIIGSFGSGIIMPFLSLILGNTINKFGNNSSATSLTPSQTADIYKNINEMSLQFFYLAIGMFVGCFLLVFGFTMNSKRIILKIKNLYFKTILCQEQGFFDKNNPYEYATKVQSQCSIIETGLGEKVGNGLMSSSICVTSFIIGFITSWQMVLVLLACVPLIGAGGIFMVKKLQESNKLSQKNYEVAGGIAEEVIYNIKTVSSFGNIHYELGRFDKLVEHSMIEGIKNGLLAGIGLGSVFFVLFITFGASFWFGGFLIQNNFTNSNTGKPFYSGDVLTVLFSVIFGSFSMGQASPNFKAVQDACIAAREFFWLLDRKPLMDLSLSIKTPSKQSLNGSVKFVNVTFAYPSDPNKNILKNINIEFEKGKKTAIVGKSGSGKSTIISLIERFYDATSGTILIDDYNIVEFQLNHLRNLLGYVPQEPVLFNVSIKENIIFGRENITEEDIKSACKKAYASEFIEKINEGYEYQVGIKGSKLSGGQKQRIAIARAILNKPKILILDEATSALDNKSEKIVQKALDDASDGLTTIIIAHRLSTVQNADKIVVLEDGIIVEQGTHFELLEKGGFYSQLVKNQLTDLKSTKKEVPINEKNINNQQTLITNEDYHKDELIVHEEKEIEEINEIENSARDEEFFNRSKSKIIEMLRDSKSTILYAAIFSSISGTVWPVFGQVMGIATGKISDKTKNVYDEGFFFGMMFLIIASIAFFGMWLQNYYFIRIGEILTKKFRSACYEKYLRVQLGFFDFQSNSPGNLLTKLSTDTTKINGVALSMVGISVQTFVMFVIAMSLGLYYDYRIALINIGFFPLMVFCSAIHMKIQQGFTTGDQKVEAEAGSILSESVINTKTIFSYNMQSKVIQYFENIQLNLIGSIPKKSAFNGVLFGLSQFLVFALYATLFYAGGQFASQGTLTIGNLLAAIFCILNAAYGVGQAQQYVKDYAASREALTSLCRVLDEPSSIDPFEKSDSKIIANQEKFFGKIEFENVTFSYPTRPHQIILKDISFTINPGQSAAFVGYSGSGKSTIVQLIERFYDVTGGRILIDGIDIRDYDLLSYRKCISIVMQEPVLFKTSLVENIRYGKLNATDEEINLAAKQAYIDYLLTRNENSNLPVSGGEKQRVAIARAILKNPKILLLDEATSALDKNSEQIVQKALDEISTGRTTIAIAHRLSTIKDYNIIFVLVDGEVLEKGTHEELLLKKGNYYNLYYESDKK